MNRNKEIVNIRIDNIFPNAYQPRKFFNEDALAELSQSIKEHGIIQPITVRKMGEKYELVAGERRWRAARMASLDVVPCSIIEITDTQSAEIALLENLQREDLNFIEEAEAYFNLINDHNFTQDQLAQRMGKKQSTIANKMRLLKLSSNVRLKCLENNLTERHARALLSLPTEELQVKVVDKVVKNSLNVKKTEEQKGKLHVDSLIKHYPDFVEAEKKGNYKDLPIFSRYLLEPKAKVLPEKIEISFLIDNSGSMNESKIEAARKAVAVTLLSLEDFNDYLEKNTEKLNQKVEVLSETWFFGSKYNNLKKFQYKNNKNREKSDIIKSITKIDGSYGATDDASCLREIADNITSYEESRLKRGQDIKILFEITDGASSFPGLAKNAVEDLMEKNVKVFAFQIGKNSDKNEELFNYVWNENFKEKHGIIIGEDVEKLPQELLNSIGNNLENIFTK